MPVDVYFKEDIAQILGAVDQAGGGTAALVNDEISKAARNGDALETEELADHLRIYRQGYRDALNAVATAFGIGVTRTIREVRREALQERYAQEQPTEIPIAFQVKRTYVE